MPSSLAPTSPPLERRTFSRGGTASFETRKLPTDAEKLVWRDRELQETHIALRAKPLTF
jgi:hypothetical protein